MTDGPFYDHEDDGYARRGHAPNQGAGEAYGRPRADDQGGIEEPGWDETPDWMRSEAPRPASGHPGGGHQSAQPFEGQGFDDHGLGAHGAYEQRGDGEHVDDGYGEAPGPTARPSRRPQPQGAGPAGAGGGRRRPVAPDGAEAYEYEALRPEWSKRRRASTVVASIAVVLALLAGVTGFWVQKQINPGGGGEAATIQVPTGSSTAGIASLLQQQDVITNATVFKLYLKVKGGGPWQAGSYTFPGGASMGEVIDVLERGPQAPPSTRFTVTPGLKLSQVPASVEQSQPAFTADAVRTVIDSGEVRSAHQPADANLEGFLMPDTYEVAEGADARAVVQTMVAQFDKVAAEVGLPDSEATVGYSPYQVLIIASLIEREAANAEEGPKIARVIYNRLRQGIPLGIDATSCYVKDQIPCVLTVSDLASDTPYNTRKAKGLPPTPIANVSASSLRSAVNPAEGNWIYYVLDPEVDPDRGGHLFTSSAAEFEQAKRRCRDAGFGCG